VSEYKYLRSAQYLSLEFESKRGPYQKVELADKVFV